MSILISLKSITFARGLTSFRRGCISLFLIWKNCDINQLCLGIIVSGINRRLLLLLAGVLCAGSVATGYPQKSDLKPHSFHHL